MSSKYQEILAARELLGLPERASMEKIKSNYRQLISQWHPDKCNAGDEKCGEMTTTSHLKIKILGQNQGGDDFQPAGILKYVEDLKEGDNAEFGPKDYFEIACKIIAAYNIILNYCSQYQYSFSEEEVRKSEPDEDWWFERFGDRH